MMIFTRKRYQGYRGNKGSTLLEGVAGIFLVSVSALSSLIFLINSLVLVLYKQQLALAASEAAQELADQASTLSWNDSFNRNINLTAMRIKASAKVNSTINSLGLRPEGGLTVNTVLDGRLIKVTVKAKGLKLPCANATVTLDENGVAPAIIVMPPGLMTVTSSTSTYNNVVIPVYGLTSSTHFRKSTRKHSQFSVEIPAPTAGVTSQQIGTVVDSQVYNWNTVYER
ncbi:MAG: hypothetical protein K2X27_07180 [Candidatus Obscuribacterales bacterium]|nr:hypothetical protein [Candidatus Obscuribacterales bacterium]